MHALLSKVPTAARLLLGTIFVVFGLNGFLSFLPMPPMPEAAGTFLGALVGTGYLMTLVKATEVAVGVLLLANRFVPLALALIAPIVVNIVLFHAVLAPAGLALPLVVLALELFLAWSYRDAFAPMLRAKTEPTAREADARAETQHAHA
ncbi:MAG: DoxX family protein [Deltaproteobacteria bacterium]|nr:DoxX family protein [Deltaproteobacteria bacterium]